MRWRKGVLDPAVRAQLDLRSHEKVLAWADDGAGRAVIASESALHLQRTPPEYSRLGWEQIEHVSYETGVMTVTLGPAHGSVRLRVPVGDDPQLPVVVRDRVTASVLVDRFVPLRGDAGVRIVGRRQVGGPAGDDVLWRAELDPTLVADAAARHEAQVAEREVRAEVGRA